MLRLGFAVVGPRIGQKARGYRVQGAAHVFVGGLVPSLSPAPTMAPGASRERTSWTGGLCPEPTGSCSRSITALEDFARSAPAARSPATSTYCPTGYCAAHVAGFWDGDSGRQHRHSAECLALLTLLMAPCTPFRHENGVVGAVRPACFYRPDSVGNLGRCVADPPGGAQLSRAGGSGPSAGELGARLRADPPSPRPVSRWPGADSPPRGLGHLDSLRRGCGHRAQCRRAVQPRRYRGARAARGQTQTSRCSASGSASTPRLVPRDRRRRRGALRRGTRAPGPVNVRRRGVENRRGRVAVTETPRRAGACARPAPRRSRSI